MATVSADTSPSLASPSLSNDLYLPELEHHQQPSSRLRHQHSLPSMSTPPRAYNTFSSAYTRRTGTAASNASRTTVFGSHDSPSHPYAQVQQQYAAASARNISDPLSVPPRMSQPESRIFGLTPDLKEPSSTDEIGSMNRISRLLSDQKPCFSVELVAPSFDDRGYPVLSGRAASVKGVVRISSQKPCDVMMTISANTTSGSPAAVWQGVALAPWSTGAEKKVFEINDRLAATSATVSNADSQVLTIPFDVNLPMGQSTRFVDGEVQTVPVALPPSFEISSKAAQQDKREIRLATKGKSKGPLAKELLEKGFEKVYRIGCYYQITWTLLRDTVPEKSMLSKKSKSAANKEPAEGDFLTLPFVFLGEPTTMPPHPPTLPSVINPAVFLESGATLGDRWDAHKSQAKWSGSLLRASRKTVDIELHIPNPLVLQSPSVLPVMVVLRPTDPTLLSGIALRSNNESLTAPTSPLAGQLDDPIEVMASRSQEDTIGGDTESIKTSRSIMSKFMNLSRHPPSTASSRRTAGSSIFGGRRPKTAPSPGSSETGVSDAYTDRTYMPQGSIPDLASLLCVSLIQTVFSSNDNVNDGPEHRRKLLSFADLEEVDVRALLLNSELSSGPGSRPGSRPGSSRSPQEMSAIEEAVVAAKTSGVRVLVGSLKIAGTTAPSFRCQGLEVKYALKVDLLPANRVGSGAEGLNSALRNLRLGRNESQEFQGDVLHTLSDAASPPSTPPGQTSPLTFGGSATARHWTIGSRTGSPSGPNVPPALYGIGISTPSDSTAPTEPLQHPSDPPMGMHQVSRSTGSNFTYGGQGMSSAASSRTGWGGGASTATASEAASGMQSSIYLSEWGRDRKTVTKLNKSIGEMWLDARVVRGHMY